MGSGKSSIGPLLANKLGYRFFDSDHLICKEAGMSIKDIFLQEGESGFRQREERCIAKVVKLSPIVLATGGGTIVRIANRTKLKQSGVVIYLKVSTYEQIQRLSLDSVQRPLLLNDPDPQRCLEKLNQKRAGYYQESADLTFPTEGHSVKNLSQEIFIKYCDFYAEKTKLNLNRELPHN